MSSWQRSPIFLDLFTSLYSVTCIFCFSEAFNLPESVRPFLLWCCAFWRLAQEVGDCDNISQCFPLVTAEFQALIWMASFLIEELSSKAGFWIVFGWLVVVVLAEDVCISESSVLFYWPLWLFLCWNHCHCGSVIFLNGELRCLQHCFSFFLRITSAYQSCLCFLWIDWFSRLVRCCWYFDSNYFESVQHSE